jgi:hypothetical protein
MARRLQAEKTSVLTTCGLRRHFHKMGKAFIFYVTKGTNRNFAFVP